MVAPNWGTGASGGLEGILHSGALYSRLDKTALFFTFLSALEDLYNWYHFDPLFSGAINCNIKDIVDSKTPRFDLAGLSPDSWFLEELKFLLPSGVISCHDDQAIRYDLSD